MAGPRNSGLSWNSIRSKTIFNAATLIIFDSRGIISSLIYVYITLANNLPQSAMNIVSDKFIEYVRKHMDAFNCPTHDMAHCLRVANLAHKIALQYDENDPESDCGSPRLAYIGGLVHDILDSKLVTAENNVHAIEAELCLLLREEQCTEEEIQLLVNIAKSVGYSKRLKRDYHAHRDLYSKEFRAVQDADLLDAIGCIGIARTYTYGGKKGRLLFGVSEGACADVISYDYYMANRGHIVGGSVGGTGVHASERTNSTTEHFFEKLLRIEHLLLSPYGKKLGKKRHRNMINYLTLLDEELCEGEEDSVSTGANVTTRMSEQIKLFAK